MMIYDCDYVFYYLVDVFRDYAIVFIVPRSSSHSRLMYLWLTQRNDYYLRPFRKRKDRNVSQWRKGIAISSNLCQLHFVNHSLKITRRQSVPSVLILSLLEKELSFGSVFIVFASKYFLIAQWLDIVGTLNNRQRFLDSGGIKSAVLTILVSDLYIQIAVTNANSFLVR